MDPEIRALAEAAGRAAKAERVLLFGSQARGDASSGSDVDLALVVPDNVERRAALRAAIMATARRRRSLDLVVLTQSTWANGSSLLARQVREEGVLAYGH
jgi:predicted nucleotidyltransferase